MHQWTAAQAVLDAATLLVAGLAAWLGEWEERTVAFGMVLVIAAVEVFASSRDRQDVQLGELIVGIIYLITVFWVALRSDRWWPLWTAAFQVVGVAVFLARMADPKIGEWASVFWSWLILITVGFGTWRHRNDLRAPRPPPSPAERVGP